MKRKFLFLLFFVFLFSSCRAENKMNDMSHSGAIQEMSQAQDNYTVYIAQASYEPAKYEYSNKNYLGAYILQDKMIEGDIDLFETAVETPHDIYTNILRQGEDFPLSWVLECYTKGKIPMIIFYPANGYDIKNKEGIEAYAKEFGRLDIPIFLQLYPNPLTYGVSSEEYKKAYASVKEIFRQYAPNVAFIWSAEIENAKENIDFYPGDETVDWIGLNIFLTQNDTKDLWNPIDYYYYTFQKDKPLMISQFAVSHYSTEDFKYTSSEAAKEIEQFYETIYEQYPRIKAINYMDFNGVQNAPQNTFRQDFTITSDSAVLTGYQKALAKKTVTSTQYIKSPFPAFIKDDKIYLSSYTNIYDLKNGEKETFGEANEYIEITGKMDYVIDSKKKRILLRYD